MVSSLRKMTDGLIIYSVLGSDFEKPDFKNDALAGVRANYFNTNYAPQHDTTDAEFDGRIYNISYSMQSDKPLMWKVTSNNRPYQSVKKATGGVYCVLCYGKNGLIYKRIYFDAEHIWLRTEYFDKFIEGKLLCRISPRTDCGIVTLRYERIEDNGRVYRVTLFPSDKPQSKNCAVLIYSNVGMLWYDADFRPEDLKEDNSSSENKSGFLLTENNFMLSDDCENALDLDSAEYLEVTNEEEAPVQEEEAEQKERPYSAYEKIEKILTEAHKTNKDLFGEVLSNVCDENGEYISDNIEEENAENAVEATETVEEENIEAEPAQSENCGLDTDKKPSADTYSYYGSLDENNRRAGHGRTVTELGLTSYEGEYLDDMKNGFGVCYYRGGQINYVGNWIDNKRSGAGVGYRLSDSTMHAGKWLDNAPEGLGARFDGEGNFIDVCSYDNGVRNGTGISFDENGKAVISTWKDGEKLSEFTVEAGE